MSCLGGGEREASRPRFANDKTRELGALSIMKKHDDALVLSCSHARMLSRALVLSCSHALMLSCSHVLMFSCSRALAGGPLGGSWGPLGVSWAPPGRPGASARRSIWSLSWQCCQGPKIETNRDGPRAPWATPRRPTRPPRPPCGQGSLVSISALARRTQDRDQLCRPSDPIGSQWTVDLGPKFPFSGPTGYSWVFWGVSCSHVLMFWSSCSFRTIIMLSCSHVLELLLLKNH